MSHTPLILLTAEILSVLSRTISRTLKCSDFSLTNLCHHTFNALLGVLTDDLRELYKPLNPFEYFDLEGDNTNLPSQAQYKSPD